MRVLAVNPILNVSDIAATIAWFAKLGWTVGFEWRDDWADPNSPVEYAGVTCGEHEIFLCRRAGRPWKRIEHRHLWPGRG